MLDLESLNVNQRRAVDWNDGPMLVLAGPGAGKTRVLTTRVARLIREAPDTRFRVLALTFTTKAADEMRQRVAGLLGPTDIRRARLTTFHGFATDVLRQYGSHLGLRTDFTILNQDADRHAVLRSALESVGDAEAPAGLTPNGVLPTIDRLLRDSRLRCAPCVLAARSRRSSPNRSGLPRRVPVRVRGRIPGHQRGPGSLVADTLPRPVGQPVRGRR